ncbi:MAG: YeeE/YedE thiosulfate transporter family protein [Yoonia sp.]|uniref:YeeE/YedE family protein n=1 Tax=Yoonia sp. TaxID=2212373 RepID=UPI00273ED2E7|nr:YeeE/YedE thiosulfate transporter family protein [Yoonia sp.]MDP5086131.1 YeeE/YedE thiosulfate transporter family protein [Yoonia sp.]
MPMEWIMGLVGGVLIGTAAAIFLLVNGRVMGASGIIGGLVDGSGRSDWFERVALIAGLIIVPGIAAWAVGGSQTYLTSNWAVIIVAGLLVGIGTRLANGCTSGHGVCGISRLSLRGIIATAFYIGAGGLTVVLFKHILGVI